MSIESSADLDGMRLVGRITRQTLDALERRVRAGVSTAILDAIAARCSPHGARSAPRCYGFRATYGRVNDEVVHGVRARGGCARRLVNLTSPSRRRVHRGLRREFRRRVGNGYRKASSRLCAGGLPCSGRRRTSGHARERDWPCGRTGSPAPRIRCRAGTIRAWRGANHSRGTVSAKLARPPATRRPDRRPRPDYRADGQRGSAQAIEDRNGWTIRHATAVWRRTTNIRGDTREHPLILTAAYSHDPPPPPARRLRRSVWLRPVAIVSGPGVQRESQNPERDDQRDTQMQGADDIGDLNARDLFREAHDTNHGQQEMHREAVTDFPTRKPGPKMRSMAFGGRLTRAGRRRQDRVRASRNANRPQNMDVEYHRNRPTISHASRTIPTRPYVRHPEPSRDEVVERPPLQRRLTTLGKWHGLLQPAGKDGTRPGQ